MALKATAEEGPHAAPFRFPKLSEDRAKEIAVEILDLSQFDEDMKLLVCELAMGLAPADVHDVVDCLNRADAAHFFVSEIFRHTVEFDDRVHAFIQEVARSAQGDQQ